MEIWTEKEQKKITDWLIRPFKNIPELLENIYLKPLARITRPIREPLKMYYTVSDSGKFQQLDFKTKTVTPDTYNGIRSFFATKDDYTTNTSDIFSVRGFRTPSSSLLGIPECYDELYSIFDSSESSDLPTPSFIQFGAVYEDNGTTLLTNKEMVKFVVTGSSGKFQNYNYVTIKYDNKLLRRELTFTEEDA